MTYGGGAGGNALCAINAGGHGGCSYVLEAAVDDV